MDILRLALMVAALAACAPSLVGLGEIPDAPTRETSGSDSAPAEDAGRTDVAPTPSDAADGAVAPDAAPVVDAAAEAGAPDVAADSPADAATPARDAAPEASESDAPRGDVDPCSGACANRPHTTMSECHATGAFLVWCADGWGDCDRLGSNGCETDLNARDNCGSCGIPCGSARFCFRGGCRPL